MEHLVQHLDRPINEPPLEYKCVVKIRVIDQFPGRSLVASFLDRLYHSL